MFIIADAGSAVRLATTPSGRGRVAPSEGGASIFKGSHVAGGCIGWPLLSPPQRYWRLGAVRHPAIPGQMKRRSCGGTADGDVRCFFAPPLQPLPCQRGVLVSPPMCRLEDHGAVVSGTKLRWSKDSGYGVVATRAMAAGRVFVDIPASVIISDTTVMGRSDIDIVIADEDAMSWPNVLILTLVYERFYKRDASYWAPYLRLLPDTFPGDCHVCKPSHRCSRAAPRDRRAPRPCSRRACL